MLPVLKTLVFVFLSSQAFAKPGASFDVTLSPAGDFTGKVTKIEGFATESNGKVRSENIKVPLSELSTGITLRDTHTKKYLEVDKFPYATLISAEGENGKGKGVIEIKGVQKEITGTYKINASELISVFKINLPDFNITGIGYKGIGVDDEVTIKVTVPLKRLGDDGKKAKSGGKPKGKKK
ncbi:MAG: YceI family protein [Bdellovibrionales bacterium]|nr:YceI family protein [Bdellovibrionales bacterium]